MTLRSITALLLAIAAALAGCTAADAEIDPADATARPRIQVADPIIRGGRLEGGAIWFVSAPDIERWRAPVEFDDLVETTVDPGTYEVTVTVVSCSTSCPTAPQVALARRERDDGAAGGRSDLSDRLIDCVSGVDLERGDVAVFEPIVELAGDVRTCLLDGRLVSTRIEDR